jgi:hypothetical protein
MKARSLFATSLFLLGLAATHEARADDAAAFADLPVGRLSAPPTKPPKHVPAGQKAPGVFTAARSMPVHAPPGQHYIAIFADEANAEAMKKGHGRGSAGTSSACLSEVVHFPTSVEDLTIPNDGEWPESIAPETTAFPSGRHGVRGDVLAIHSERLVEGKGGASLEWSDAWVDPLTRGAKPIARGSLPLKLIRTSDFGVKVYAARDERLDGRRFVQFVVSRPLKETESAPLDSLSAARQDGSTMHSRCSYIRVGLPVDKEMNDSVSVAAAVILPSLGDDGKAAPAPKAQALSEAPAVARKPGRRKAQRQIDPVPEPPPPPPPMGVPLPGGREIRIRELSVELGVSQTSRDKEPLVSASLGWAGRERPGRLAPGE